MIIKIFTMIVLVLSTSIYASEISQATPRQANEAITLEQLSKQLEGLIAKLEAVSNESEELKKSIVSNTEKVQQQLTQINTKNAETVQYLKQQNLDYKSFEKSGVDLSLFMNSPNDPAWINFFAVIVSIGGSILLSLYFLHKTLQRETNKQLTQIQIDADKRFQEHIELLNAQKSGNNELLQNQKQLSDDEHKEHHNVVIDEFRQKWINTFRDEASNYVRIATQLLHFYEVEKGILSTVKNLKSSERSLAEFREEFNKKHKGTLNPWLINEEPYYIELKKHEDEARKDFESIKSTYLEFKKFEAELIEKKVKVSFMLNPDKDAKSLNDKVFDKEILNCITVINDSFISEQRVYQAFTNKALIQTKLNEFQTIVPLMLKAEWDRVQRKHKTKCLA